MSCCENTERDTQAVCVSAFRQGWTARTGSCRPFDVLLIVLEEEILGATVGRAKAEYTAPHRDFDTETLKGKAGFGIAADLTLMEVVQDVEIGELATIDGRITGGTVNGHVTAEGEINIKGFATEGSVKASAGAEVMEFDARAGIELSITPKSVFDAYNEYVDPVVDWVAGNDVPGLPELSDDFDHGLVIGGHVEGGIGASAKAGGGVVVGDGKGFRVSGNVKVGLGLVGGAGATFGFK